MLDLPALYLDYNKGPLWLRVGNQQIAWGEALFFRVFDAVQGLDLRRHSVFGVAADNSTAVSHHLPYEEADLTMTGSWRLMRNSFGLQFFRGQARLIA